MAVAIDMQPDRIGQDSARTNPVHLMKPLSPGRRGPEGTLFAMRHGHAKRDMSC